MLVVPLSKLALSNVCLHCYGLWSHVWMNVSHIVIRYIKTVQKPHQKTADTILVHGYSSTINAQ